MKYKGLLITDLSGSIDGVTASRNSSGNYLRARVKPVNPNTDAQSAARALFGNQSAAYRSLTETQRSSFIEQAPNYPNVAPDGTSVPLTGQQLYMRLNNQLAQLGLPVITNCPPPIEVASASVAGFDISGGAFELQDLSATGADDVIAVYASVPQSAGVAFNARPLKHITTKLSGGAVGDLDISAEYILATGYDIADAPAGSKVFVMVRRVSTINGQASADTQYTVITA